MDLHTGQMASKSGARKPWYQSKARLLAECAPFEIAKVIPAQECYVDKATLQAFDITVFTGSFKTETDVVGTISIWPEEFRRIQAHDDDAMAVFSRVGLDPYFSLPAWGVDVERAYQLLSTIEEDGSATIRGSDGQAVMVRITENTVQDALLVPKGN